MDGSAATLEKKLRLWPIYSSTMQCGNDCGPSSSTPMRSAVWSGSGDLGVVVMGSARGGPIWLRHVFRRLWLFRMCGSEVDHDGSDQGGPGAEQINPARRGRPASRGVRHEYGLSKGCKHCDHACLELPGTVTSTETVGFAPTCPPIAQPINTTSRVWRPASGSSSAVASRSCADLPAAHGKKVASQGWVDPAPRGPHNLGCASTELVIAGN